MRVLWELAFDAHARGGEGKGSDALADIGEHRLEKALAALNNEDRNWARKLVETMKFRAGLLLERAPEVITFYHRTFQEYLAGAHLAGMKDLHKEGAALAEEPGTWREIILLVVGSVIHVDAETTGPLVLAVELCPEKVEDEEKSWRMAWLTGKVLREMGLNRVQDSRLWEEMLIRARKRLAVAFSSPPSLPPPNSEPPRSGSLVLRPPGGRRISGDLPIRGFGSRAFRLEESGR